MSELKVSKSKIIKIQISKYLTNSLAEKIAAAQWKCTAPEWINRIRRATYEDSYFYDCFDVIAMDEADNVVGRLHCIQNDNDKSLWYYGDLFVISEYRRIGVATQMIQSAINHLGELGAKTLRVYVSPDNAPSIALQKGLGFFEKPYQVFNNLMNDGEKMFELELPCLYSVIPARPEEAEFVRIFYQQNIEILHGKSKPLDEWKKILSTDGGDEQNFLICRGCMPLAWLSINGLCGNNIPWIHMLAVSDIHQRQGIGSYAIGFSERFAKEKGFKRLGIHISDDNIPAQNLCRKCGYTLAGQEECEADDGVWRMGYIFVKEL